MSFDVDTYVLQAWLLYLENLLGQGFYQFRAHFLWTWDVVYQVLFEIAVLYLSTWLTHESCHQLSYSLAFVINVLVYVRLTLLGMKLVGQFLSWLINLLFTKSSELLTKLLHQLFSRVFYGFWQLLTFFPRLVWRSLFK